METETFEEMPMKEGMGGLTTRQQSGRSFEEQDISLALYDQFTVFFDFVNAYLLQVVNIFVCIDARFVNSAWLWGHDRRGSRHGR